MSEFFLHETARPPVSRRLAEESWTIAGVLERHAQEADTATTQEEEHDEAVAPLGAAR